MRHGVRETRKKNEFVRHEGIILFFIFYFFSTKLISQISFGQALTCGRAAEMQRFRRGNSDEYQNRSKKLNETK